MKIAAWRILGIIALALLLPPSAVGVVVLGSGDPDFNDVRFNPPAGPLLNCGLQFVGDFGGFIGTPVGPAHFIAAGHVGNRGPLAFRGVTYPVLSGQGIAGTDLVIWQIDTTVAGPFPAWSPLFTAAAGSNAELGRKMVVFGKGRKRGADVIVNGQLAGWRWGDADFNIRWGINTVSAKEAQAGLGFLVIASFDSDASSLGVYECALSEFDSSGSMFIQEAGVWKLAGVHYGVDGPFAFVPNPVSGESFFATLFDERGLYASNDTGGFTLVTGSAPQASIFGSSSISASLEQIKTIIGLTNSAVDTFTKWRNACFTAVQLADPSVSGPEADPDRDGLTNFQEYAFGSAPWEASPAAAPQVGRTTVGGADYLTVAFSKAKSLTDVSYIVEVSGDLQGWTSSAGSTVLVSEMDAGDTMRVVMRDATALTTIPGAQRFIRVRTSAQ